MRLSQKMVCLARSTVVGINAIAPEMELRGWAASLAKASPQPCGDTLDSRRQSIFQTLDLYPPKAAARGQSRTNLPQFKPK